MFCNQCGKKIEIGSSYCTNCGKWIKIAQKIKHYISTSPRDCAAGIHYGYLFTATLFFLTVFYLIIFVLQVMESANFFKTFFGLILGSFFAFLPLVVVLPMILWIDRFEPEPPKLLFIAFFGGGLISVLIALTIQLMVDPIIYSLFHASASSIITPSFIAPLTEEPAKALIVLAIYFLFRHEFDGVSDGIVYGMLTGLGFEAFENIIYFSSAFTDGGFHGMIGNFVLRWFFGALGHAYYTGVFGIALGLTIFIRDRFYKVAIALAGLFTAMFLHFCWNFVCSVFGNFVSILLLDMFLLLPCFVIIVIASYFSLKRESKLVTEMLKDEILGGLLTEPEYISIASVTTRFYKGFNILFNDGLEVWNKYRTLTQALTKLAFLKYQQKLQGFFDANLQNKIEDQRNYIIGYRNFLESKGFLR